MKDSKGELKNKDSILAKKTFNTAKQNKKVSFQEVKGEESNEAQKEDDKESKKDEKQQK